MSPYDPKPPFTFFDFFHIVRKRPIFKCRRDRSLDCARRRVDHLSSKQENGLPQTSGILMARSLIALFLLSLPLLEIAGFIVVGRRIGLGPTLLLVIASAVIGLAILRRQGFQALTKLRQRRLPQDLPAERFFDTAIVLLSGLLLIVPGFVTNLIALLLLVPAIRQRVASRLASRFVVVDFTAAADPHATRPSPPRTIDLDDGDFTREDRP
ncbi:UPF0716 protein FxsA [Mycoplana sp. BE70]|uniref:FxsA family protein n=1 Tax=Mycoplana sp. BE70 TaxID=2817775 RepID=UPI00285F0D2E|nr:FxsA family protein [Mycoplana sp. BE70]MDR6755895.1 UPF0716 protein FxsA [Mycoplana sp. BE70]